MSAPTDSPWSAARSPAADEYAVKLPIFEGPLDLLLHLIRINEVEITDIPIATIAEQYLAALDLMRELDLDVAGEYLLLAATLAWIKSRMLLPPDPSEVDEAGVDPRAELVARLLEYQRFKEAAQDLDGRQLLGRDVFPAQGAEPEAIPESEREIEVGIFQLMEAFRQALRRVGPRGLPHEVEIETVTVRDRILAVMRFLADRESCEFEELLFEGGQAVSRAALVASFLAILELTRLEAIGLYQGIDAAGVPVGPIHIRRRSALGDASWMERISDLM
jgi:segregation and condensation protein A